MRSFNLKLASPDTIMAAMVHGRRWAEQHPHMHDAQGVVEYRAVKAAVEYDFNRIGLTMYAGMAGRRLDILGL